MLLLCASGTDLQAAVEALNGLCDILEAAERQYQELIGDPQVNPGQRAQYPIGMLLLQLDSANVMHIHDRWTFKHEVKHQLD